MPTAVEYGSYGSTRYGTNTLAKDYRTNNITNKYIKK
jgi:hypothetical protein